MRILFLVSLLFLIGCQEEKRVEYNPMLGEPVYIEYKEE